MTPYHYKQMRIGMPEQWHQSTALKALLEATAATIITVSYHFVGKLIDDDVMQHCMSRFVWP